MHFALSKEQEIPALCLIYYPDRGAGKEQAVKPKKKCKLRVCGLFLLLPRHKPVGLIVCNFSHNICILGYCVCANVPFRCQYKRHVHRSQKITTPTSRSTKNHWARSGVGWLPVSCLVPQNGHDVTVYVRKRTNRFPK
jgi:hypothetical protein